MEAADKRWKQSIENQSVNVIKRQNKATILILM